MRKILLIEPDYKNKYPPIGLMKISTYHKLLGDEVRFFKGNVNELVVEARLNQCLQILKDQFNFMSIDSAILEPYFKHRKKDLLEALLQELEVSDNEEIREAIRGMAFSKPEATYDRVYVTTLFTFYWNVSIKSIQQAKNLVARNEDIKVGGVMASLLTGEMISETGIVPMKGLLDKPGVLDKENKFIVDDLPLDYSILEEIDYEYPTKNAYFTFMTKGCTRKCAFCSVPKLEPTYRDRVPTIDKFRELSRLYGEPKNLLLMDNNVLASPKFPEIVNEIKEMGFYKGATFRQPNQLEIAYRNLRMGYNDKAFTRRIVKLLLKQYSKQMSPDSKKAFKEVLVKYSIHNYEYVTKDNLIKAYPEITRLYEKNRKKAPVARYVDFNQGIDARYVNEENMRLLGELNVKPLRIAFDFIGMKKQYINAVELAAQNGIKGLSNYILYNFKDKPDDLYERLKINVDLNKRLGLRIFSFPMKFIPLFGEEAKHRRYVGEHWNPKFIRTIQSILNSTKGIVAPGEKFFNIAFGKTIKEFHELLYMPETFIVYRMKFKESGLTQEWREAFNSLNPDELREAKLIIEKNDFNGIETKTPNNRIYSLLKYYTIKPRDLEGVDIEREKLRSKFNQLIKKDIFIDLTLTYDYDRPYRKPRKIAV